MTTDKIKYYDASPIESHFTKEQMNRIAKSLREESEIKPLTKAEIREWARQGLEYRRQFQQTVPSYAEQFEAIYGSKN